eukprot:jgi/Chlat1/4691/Chrsp3S05627
MADDGGDDAPLPPPKEGLDVRPVRLPPQQIIAEKFSSFFHQGTPSTPTNNPTTISNPLQHLERLWRRFAGEGGNSSQRGYVRGLFGPREGSVCRACEGTGRVVCSNCGGRGRHPVQVSSGDFWQRRSHQDPYARCGESCMEQASGPSPYSTKYVSCPYCIGEVPGLRFPGNTGMRACPHCASGTLVA